MADEAAERLLAKLLDRWERRTDTTMRRVTLSISGRDGADYFAISGERRERLHATLRNAAHVGAVDLEWGRFEAAHELKRLVLKDGNALAVFLGRSLMSKAVADLDKKIEPLLTNAAHSWIADAYRDARARWLRGLPVCRLSPTNNAEDIIRLFVALKTVSEESHSGMDMRTFSARILGDSKAMERLQIAFTRMWCNHHALEPITPTDLFATLGLEKAPQPVLLRGKLKSGASDLSALRPFVGLPGERLAALHWNEVPSYILTIENLASFQRHCREIDDEGLILFSSGFPNPSVQAMLRRLDADIPPSIQFFHWGDTDVRGIEILAFVASLCPSRTVKAHLMDRSPWQGERRATGHELKALDRIAHGRSSASSLAQRLMENGIPSDFEQENHNPAPPAF